MATKTAAAKAAIARGRRKSLRLHGTIARDIGVAIVSGQHKPGDVLNGEIDASDQLRVSRTAYREAVRILAAKGLVESRPKVGTRVSLQEHWHLLDPDVLSWIFEFEPDDGLLASLFELRKIVEPKAAELAAERRTDADLRDMADALARMAQHSLSAEAGRHADQDFHAALLRASGNAFIVSLTSGIVSAVTWTTLFKQMEQPLPRDLMQDHMQVYEAIAATNPKAAHRAMTSLVETAFRDAMAARKSKVEPLAIT